MDLIKSLEDKRFPEVDLIARDLSDLDGDLMILGAGGKMGPCLAILAKMAIDRSGSGKRVIAVSRFGDQEIVRRLKKSGIETIRMDLLESGSIEKLPDIQNIIYMAGSKFGTSSNAAYTWAVNAYLPGKVAEKFKKSRIVVFSSGNVYPFVFVGSGGPTEDMPPDPVGEYAQSVLGRERIFQYYSEKYGTPVLLFRLNYAIDLQYGVLMDIAQSVINQNPVNLQMGYVNIIWQGDANHVAIRCLKHCSSPPNILNVTGLHTLSVRRLAGEFARIFNTKPVFENSESETALLSNSSRMHELYPFQKMEVDEMIQLTADWIISGGEILNKPTHFQERTGKF